VVIPASLSLAWHLGIKLITATAAKTDPVAAVLQLYQGAGRLLLTGKVVDVQRNTADGFVTGYVKITKQARSTLQQRQQYEGPACETADCSVSISNAREAADALCTELVVEFQNENLVVRQTVPGECVLATVPDLICCLESSTGAAVATEDIRYGLQVSVVVLPAHPALRTAEALEVVGPAAFGIADVQYKPVGSFPVIPSVHELFHQKNT
jgi:DUF917 family protein